MKTILMATRLQRGVRTLLLTLCLLSYTWMAYADETITVTATNSDISENLDLKIVATLFGQAKDLEEFETMLNHPDSAFSNLDLNGDGNVDYLRVVESADENRHLVVIQAVLAKDIYQDVASIFVEKDAATQSVTVQVIGDEYIYGQNYIIEPVYIYRPYIYDWFWGPSWVCWHSPYYWDYWPVWWHPYHCVAYHMYWDHCYWHHHHYPICSYRTAYHHHPHYRPMREHISRRDYARRHPDRSFTSRNATRNVTNARDFDRARSASVRSAAALGRSTGTTRVSTRSTQTSTRTFGSTNVRGSSGSAATTSTRVGNTSGRTSATRSSSVTTTRTTSTTTRAAGNAVTTRSSSTSRTSVAPARTSTSGTTSGSTVRSSSTTSSRSAGTVVRSSGSTSTRSTSGSTVRSSGSSTSRSSSSVGSSMRTSGGSSSSSRSGGSTRR